MIIRLREFLCGVLFQYGTGTCSDISATYDEQTVRELISTNCLNPPIYGFALYAIWFAGRFCFVIDTRLNMCGPDNYVGAATILLWPGYS